MFKEMKNKEYRGKAVVVLVISFLVMFFFAYLNNDQANVLNPYYSTTYGWSSGQITAPITVGSYLAIPLVLLFGTLLMKAGVKKVLTTVMVIAGISTIGLAVAGDNYPVYYVCLLILRSLTQGMSMGIVMLCTNWFCTLRGRALGLVTMGFPLSTALLVPALTKGADFIGFKGSYSVLGVIVIIMAAIVAVATKDRPQDLGMNQDGADVAPVEEAEKTMSFKEVFSEKRAWLLTFSYGLLSFVIVGVMAFFTIHMMNSGVETNTYLLALSVGSLLGFPLSYILGVIDDKLGTAKASIVLCFFFLIALIALLTVKNLGVVMIVLAAVGIGGMTGGVPNLSPSMTAYVYGVKNFQAANRWIKALQDLLVAPAPFFMAMFLDKTGTLTVAYYILIVMVLISIVLFAILGKTPDHDRALIEEEMSKAG